jgi:hypothetical protein
MGDASLLGSFTLAFWGLAGNEGEEVEEIEEVKETAKNRG